MIEIKNISYKYAGGKTPVFSDFSLNLPESNIYGLLGKNGTGKSTLLYLISGLLRPQGGTVSFDGIESRKRRPEMLEEIRHLESDDDLFNYIESQPQKLQEKLFDIAMRALKAQSCKISERFNVRVVNDDQILEEALKYPLEKWRVFLHPKQEEVIATDINQSVLLTGAPGTGKTVCLVHKAKKLEPFLGIDECVIISTFKSIAVH